MKILQDAIRMRVIGMIAFLLTLAILATLSAAGQSATSNRKNVLFTQQDTVVAFDFVTGLGQQVGTVAGHISGTSIVNFQFIPTSPTTFNFNNAVVITDLDGDQIEFSNAGTGSFLMPPIDPAVFALGGPMSGTYEVTKGTGKFSAWVGKKFPSRAVISNPVPRGLSLGTVYVEVLSNPLD